MINPSIVLFDVGLEDLRRADRRGPRQAGADVAVHLGDPPSPGNQDHDEQKHENCYCGGHRRTTCRFDGSKCSELSWMTASVRRSVEFGRAPVVRRMAL